LKLIYRSRHDMEPVFLGPLESQEGLKQGEEEGGRAPSTLFC